MKVLDNTDPLRDITCHWCPLGFQVINHYPLDVTAQSIPYPSNNSPSTESISLQFRAKDVVGDHIKSFTEAQRDDICSPSPVHWYSYSITEAQQVGQAGVALGEAVLAVLNHLPMPYHSLLALQREKLFIVYIYGWLSVYTGVPDTGIWHRQQNMLCVW